MKHLYFLIFVILFFQSCSTKNHDLPYLGRHEYSETDTIFHTIKSFSFYDQDSSLITNEIFDNKIYVTDFFFTTCPSICPTMKVQMLRIYEAYKENPNVLLLSHTIDPAHDNVEVLHDYATRLGVSSKKWHFVTGIKDSIYNMAHNSYYIGARENEKAPGGYEHSGAFIIVDGKRRIRGVYDGTKPESVDQLIEDLKKLLAETNE
ncbi:MAG: SCO family protein [Bacteroidota bacterium]